MLQYHRVLVRAGGRLLCSAKQSKTPRIPSMINSLTHHYAYLDRPYQCERSVLTAIMYLQITLATEADTEKWDPSLVSECQVAKGGYNPE